MSVVARLLNDPPEKFLIHSAEPQPEAIPFPLLPQMLRLADKFNLSPAIVESLNLHLYAHVDANPLRVYGLACQYDIPDVADAASKRLHNPPLESYSIDEIAIIPTAEDYHKLLCLQRLRKAKLSALLKGEEIFPHGYGECWTHKDYTKDRWREARQEVLKRLDASQIFNSLSRADDLSNLAGLDVARKLKAEADDLIANCVPCSKAWIAATDMLEVSLHSFRKTLSLSRPSQYKCRKAIRKVSQVPRNP